MPIATEWRLMALIALVAIGWRYGTDPDVQSTLASLRETASEAISRVDQATNLESPHSVGPFEAVTGYPAEGDLPSCPDACFYFVEAAPIVCPGY
ncbi:MAG: hypothetical protein KDA80_02860 [Planctomycetaceae bacterium]|nr:hypothetical protein [Planctomycetaceae bacterium]